MNNDNLIQLFRLLCLIDYPNKKLVVNRLSAPDGEEKNFEKKEKKKSRPAKKRKNFLKKKPKKERNNEKKITILVERQTIFY